MSFDQNNRIAHFLSEYLTESSTGAPIPPLPVYIRAGIKLIISEKVMSAETLKADILREYNVIIPHDYFPKETTTR